MHKLALALLLAMTLAVSAAPSHGAATTAIDWQPCDGELECATVTVPLDHANPDGETIGIAIARLSASDPATRIGSLLINPGGPGASGIEFLRGYGDDPPAAWHDNFDIIGFDPRGTGESVPVDCTDTPAAMTDIDQTPDTPEEEAALFEAARTFADDCEREYGPALAYLATENAARDIEAIRVALGEEQITYFGFSYGTFLGATYAGLFPERVRAFVLDGAIDPSLTGEEWVTAQGLGFESAFEAFLADCTADEDCTFQPEAGTTLGETFDAIMARIEDAPLTTADGNEVPIGMAWTGVAQAMYDPGSFWPLLRNALDEAKRGDGSGLWNLAGFYNGRNQDGTYDDFIEAFSAITCVDVPYPRTEDEYIAMLQRVDAAAPRFGGWAIGSTNLPCTFWAFDATGEPGEIHATGAPPIVVVGTINDPATPYEWSQGLASQLESGVLLTRVGEGHTAYNMGNPCIDDLLDTYIVTLEAPADGTVCQEDGVAESPTPAPADPTPTPATGVAPPETEEEEGDRPVIVWAAVFGIAAIAIVAFVVVRIRSRRRA